MHTPPFIVGLGGTTRPGSTSERALAVALEAAAAAGCETRLFGAGTIPCETYDPTRPESLGRINHLFVCSQRLAAGSLA